MKNQKVRNFAVILVAAMLLATTAISMSTSVDVFAYKKNQAASQANACGNGEIPTNVGCQNTGSQIQGDENSVALAAQQTFPSVAIGDDNGNGVDECVQCIEAVLDADQIAALEAELGLQINVICEQLASDS